jgi:hypothetical protein
VPIFIEFFNYNFCRDRVKLFLVSILWLHPKTSTLFVPRKSKRISLTLKWTTKHFFALTNKRTYWVQLVFNWIFSSWTPTQIRLVKTCFKACTGLLIFSVYSLIQWLLGKLWDLSKSLKNTLFYYINLEMSSVIRNWKKYWIVKHNNCPKN